MNGGDFDFVSGQPGGDLIGAVALQRHCENAPDYGGSFSIHQPIFPLFIPQIAINHRPCQVLACHALGLEYRFDFTARVTGVKFVHNIQEWGHVVVPFFGVYIVVNGN